jgi:hypothetical protein
VTSVDVKKKGGFIQTFDLIDGFHYLPQPQSKNG